MSDLADNYLRDLGLILRQDWEESERALASASSEQQQFEAGLNRAYRRVLTLMLQQAESFELPASAICLDGIDVGKDLGY